MSEHIKFYSLNLASQSGTTISASSEDAFFPANNLKHPFSTKVYRSATGTSTASIVFDLKTTEDIDSILVRGNVVEGAGFDFSSLTIEANPTDSWGAPAYSSTITVNSEFNLGIKTISPAESYRFWRITGTGTDYLEFSNIFIGKYTQLASNNIDFGWSYERRDLSNTKKNRYGQKFSDKIAKQDMINAKFKLLNISEYETLQNMFNVHGETEPLWCVVNEDAVIISDEERFAGMFFLKKIPKATNGSFGLYDLPFTLEGAM